MGGFDSPIDASRVRVACAISHSCSIVSQGAAALALAKPANAAYGDSANVFGKVSNPTGA
jgi:hypothetical protein